MMDLRLGRHVAEIHLGHIFHLAGTPLVNDAAAALVSIADGALVVADDGRVAFCGHRADVPAQYRSAPVCDHRPGFLLPGFVDTHVHFPQTFAGDSHFGGHLLDWLSACAYPAEARFADPEFAARAAAEFCDRRVVSGTTAAMVFGSAFPHAQDALFAETARRGLRIVSGRGIQTTGPRAAARLITSEDEALRLVGDEIERWHAADTGGDAGTARLHVAIVPRFSLAVTARTLKSLGELYDSVRDRGVYFHTHLNEDNRPGTGDVDETRKTYGVDACLDLYDGRFLPGARVGGPSLLGRRSIFAHAVHCRDSELARMSEAGASIAHCPVSQQFLGTGTMPWRRTVASGVNVCAGTDFGAGDQWPIPQALNAAFKAHISEPGAAAVSLHPAQLLFLGTLGGARALDMDDRFGNFDAGKEADFVVVDPARTPSLHAAVAHGLRSGDATTARDQTLFAVLMGARETSVAATYVQGRRLRP